MDKLTFLTLEHIYRIHQKSIERFGGDSGYFDNTEGKIESVLAQQFSFFGHDKYPTIFQKAAMLLYFFVKGHCFVDGNKRVGVKSATIFLNLNGYEETFDDDRCFQKAIDISTSHVPDLLRDQYIDSIAEWLRKNFKSCTPNT